MFLNLGILKKKLLYNIQLFNYVFVNNCNFKENIFLYKFFFTKMLPLFCLYIAKDYAFLLGKCRGV